MIIEQAFYNLPEILVGAGYAKQEYEAGIVSAYSLALLQELNGRNVSLPISAIYAEKQFSAKFSGLRSDLHRPLARPGHGWSTHAHTTGAGPSAPIHDVDSPTDAVGDAR